MPMETEDTVGEIKECNHVFHENCLKEWLKQKNECPLCKIKVDCIKEAPAPRIPDALRLMRGILPGLDGDLLQPQAPGAQSPLESYFRQLRDIQREMEILDLPEVLRDEQRSREISLAVLAMTLQMRQLHRNTLRRRRDIFANNRPFVIGNIREI